MRCLVMDCRTTWATFKSKLKKLKKIHSKKFLVFQEMEFASSKIKIILYFRKQNFLALYVRREISELKKKRSKKQQQQQQQQKTKTKTKKHSEEVSYILGNGTFQHPPKKLIKLCYAQSIFMFMIKLSQEKVNACVRPHLVASPSLCSPCVTYGTPCHSIGCQVHPTLFLPREANDFLRGGKHFNHVPLLTQLIYFPPKGAVRECYQILYQPLAGFELTILLIIVYIVRIIFYLLGHRNFQ